MSHSLVRYSIVAATGCLLAAWGCGGGPSRMEQVAMDPAGSAARAMEKYDTNKDGKIAGAELNACPSLKGSLKIIDKNGDGAIDAGEIEARVQQWKDSRVGRMGLTVRVLRKGEALVGAEVKFVPEEFLGAGFETGKGTTDKMGAAQISVPLKDPEDPPGISPGFYRVEITKAGDNIPEKFNAKTTLGMEISQEVLGTQSSISFNVD